MDRSQNLRTPRERGFVGVVFLAIALIGIIIAAIAAMSRTSSAGTQSESLKAGASTVIAQAADFKLAFDRVEAAGVRPENISFDDYYGDEPEIMGQGMFDSTPGRQYGILHIAPESIAAPALPGGGSAPYGMGTIKMPGLGGPEEEYVVGLFVKSLEACQMLNHVLFNEPLSTVPAHSTLSDPSDFTQFKNTDDRSATGVNYVGRPSACIEVHGTYVFYSVMLER